MAGCSILTNLFSVIPDISQLIDCGLQTDVLYLDFSKAFDQLDHGILLNKLQRFGFSWSLPNFFISYLAVQYEQWTCCLLQFMCGKCDPQGSVLGLSLFVLFIDDLTNVIIADKLYADDTRLEAV